ncbi:MAG: ornithine carbamoyltransferase [Chitinispirillales bacterium]|jgi:ornithine carbamoyltransferase|nr:ornithine carbamoyltransferase [Chitinispirillales bacterium]
MRKKDLLTLFEYTAGEIGEILALAAKRKADRGASEKKVLEGKTGVLIFEKPSLRTRVTFETAIHELGGYSVNLASESVGMGKRESVEDVARNLERIVHVIIARTYAHGTLTSLAASCGIPVINALTDRAHPCQALAFGLTMREARPAGQKLNVAFVGDGNNVCCSIMALSAKLGYNFTAAGPKGYEPRAEAVERCRGICLSSGGSTSITSDVSEAVKNADVISTAVWASMGQEAEAEKRKKDFAAYQVNAELLKRAPAGVLVSHCLPAHRGEEITGEVLDSSACVAYDEAENRLHVQKAVIEYLFS